MTRGYMSCIIYSMRSRKTPSPSEVDTLRSLLKTLWPLLAGGVTVMRRPCARPKRSRCRACRSGKNHPTAYLSLRQEGRTRNVYLPKEVILEVERGVENWRRLQEAVRRASVAWVEGRKALRAAR